jgi:hypothetical protein
MYHACLARVFQPLKAGMTTPEVVRCPDGHFRRAIYGLGPYIADYPEQVWLASIVQNWCPKCVLNPTPETPCTNISFADVTQNRISSTPKMHEIVLTRKPTFLLLVSIPVHYGMNMGSGWMWW